MFDPNEYRCQGTVYNPFHSLEYLGGNAVTGMDSGFIVDVRDLGDKYMLEAELPGYSKSDVDLRVNDEFLTLSVCSDKVANGTATSRSFDMTGVNTYDIRAVFSNEVLTLELPKKGSSAAASRRLDIE